MSFGVFFVVALSISSAASFLLGFLAGDGWSTHNIHFVEGGDER